MKLVLYLSIPYWKCWKHHCHTGLIRILTGRWAKSQHLSQSVFHFSCWLGRSNREYEITQRHLHTNRCWLSVFGIDFPCFLSTKLMWAYLLSSRISEKSAKVQENYFFYGTRNGLSLGARKPYSVSASVFLLLLIPLCVPEAWSFFS